MAFEGIVVPVIALVSGIALLVKSSDIFVESSAKIAKLFGISEFFIGLTIVAIGTSLPEMATSMLSVLSGYSELGVGTLVGSNIANIGLILGIAIVLIVIIFLYDIYCILYI